MSEPIAETVQPGVEAPANDFPYYTGKPTAITVKQWWFVMGMNVLGYLVLVSPLLLLFASKEFYAQGFGSFIPAILYPLIPLLGLRLVAGPHWIAIFRRIGFRDVLWMFAFAILNMLITIPMAYLVSHLNGAAANPAIAGLASKTDAERVLFILKTAPSLLGEEVMTILPFLALLYLFAGHWNQSRKSAIIGAWLISSLLFGAAHFPTYNWDVLQCLLVIGSARLALTLAYIKTKNIWVSTGAHIINDWAFFGFTILAATVAGAK